MTMKKRGKNFFDWLIVIGGLIILTWALLKSFGIINSPLWVDMLPYFGGGVSIIGGAYQLGRIKKGIEQTEDKLEQTDGKVDKLLMIEPRLIKLESEHTLAMQGKIKH